MDQVHNPVLVGYMSRKAAQICAYFAKLSGESIEKLKLIKLIYLAEREFLKRHGHPMLWDEMFSLPHGPICSNTLNGINGELDQKDWSEFIVRLSNRDVSSLIEAKRDQLDEISNAELDVLNGVWESFGWMSAPQIRNYTHKNCPEYTELEQGRLPISYKDVFEALGEPNAAELEDDIVELRRAQSILLA